jgi:hypothetical protein
MVLLSGKPPFLGYCCNTCLEKIYLGSAISIFVIARQAPNHLLPIRMKRFSLHGGIFLNFNYKPKWTPNWPLTGLVHGETAFD